MAQPTKSDPIFVSLVGVPHYRQGEGDGLCTLYSMTMVLTAMFPSVRHRLMNDTDGLGGSPLATRLERKQPGFLGVFKSGQSMAACKKQMESIASHALAKPGPHFLKATIRYGKRNWGKLRDIGSFEAAVRQGYPVLFAGSGPLSTHAAVAVAFDRSEKSIGLLDPDDESRIRWHRYEDVCTPAEIIVPRRWPFDAPPLDKLEWDEDEPWISRWDLTAGRYLRWKRPAERSA